MSGSRFASFKDILLGKPKDPLDPQVFHQISLVAFLAWVGLGADGLSSSAYGPEEAYLALGQHSLLALPLAIMMAITVFVISASYSQIIELFPTGGGGYLVATKLLGEKVGLVSGSALVVDYMLTITISVASGADALFSFLPASVQGLKLFTEIFLILGLIFLNLRGTKESVQFLLPIFLLFVLAHGVAITLGVGTTDRRTSHRRLRFHQGIRGRRARYRAMGDLGDTPPCLQSGRRHLHRNRSRK